MEALPRKLKKREADVTPKIMEWFYKNYPYDVCVELKIGNKRPKPHQQAALDKIKNGSFTYKIPDMGRVNPFDFIVLKSSLVHSIWCTYFPEERKMVIIDITDGNKFIYNI